jgi:hypothetical protein
VSKENGNPQFGKRKTTSDEPSVKVKLLQDLKSESRNLRALLSSRVEHLDIAGKKRKGQDDSNKPAKSHAVLANPKGAKGKAKKSTNKVAISLARNYVSREDSTESE